MTELNNRTENLIVQPQCKNSPMYYFLTIWHVYNSRNLELMEDLVNLNIFY